MFLPDIPSGYLKAQETAPAESGTRPEKPPVKSGPESIVTPTGEAELRANLQKLVTIHNFIKNNYVQDVSSAKLFESAFKGMLNRLDPYSDYLTAEEYRDFQIGSGSEFAGIGIEVSFEDGLFTVITPLEGTPAFRAGLQPGDRILEIDGSEVAKLTMSECTKLIRGPAGSRVILTILHRDSRLPEKIAVTREVIKLKSIKESKIVDEADQIGYIRITAFQEETLTAFDDALDGLKKKGLKSLIIDLRFNGGGLMNQAVDLANRFIPNGVIVSTRERSDKNTDVEFRADPAKATCSDLPLVVLINNGTASASEIFAGAVQDHGKGILVGGRSYGKAAVQTIIPFPEDKSAVKLTVAQYYTPSGKSIQRNTDHSTLSLTGGATKNYGLDPDILLEMTPQQEAELFKSWRSDSPAGSGINSVPTQSGRSDKPAPPSRDGINSVPPQSGPDEKTELVDIQLDKAVELLRGNKESNDE